jgi:hypothetical protein
VHSPVECLPFEPTMAKMKPKDDSGLLKGWAAIAKFLGLTPVTVQRWARAGMPVRRDGRFALANRADLEAWIAKESGMPKPAHVLTGGARAQIIELGRRTSAAIA